MFRLGAIADFLAAAFCRLWGLLSPSAWSTRIARRLSNVTATISDGRHDYKFVASMPLLHWRARTIFSKEPETIKWLKTMTSEDLLWDVGANVGTFSVVAGKICRGVVAFEPEGGNFSILNRNIELNGLNGKVLAYPIAIAGNEGFDTLRLHSLEPGAALHAFGGNVDFRGEVFTPKYLQGAFSSTIDDLAYKWGLEFPTYIKIDVDGLEAAILSGAERVLGDPRLRGLLVEFNELQTQDVNAIAKLERLGFKVSDRGELVQDEPGTMRMRNYIFEKSSPP